MIARWARAVSGRYVLLAVGFAVLAALRFAYGAPLWGCVFATATAINVWLAIHEGQAPPAEPHLDSPDTEEIRAAWQVQHGSLRRWRVLACVALAIAGGLLMVEPALSVLAAATALLCLFRARRARRDTTTLRQALEVAS